MPTNPFVPDPVADGDPVDATWANDFQSRTNSAFQAHADALGSVASASDLALKSAKAANLSDLADAGSARANLHSQVLASVRVVAASNLTLSGIQTVDGVALVAGDRVLAAAQTTGSQNGPWVVAAGAWTRPTDYPAGATTIRSRQVLVNEGTNSGLVWQTLSSASRVVGTDATTWALAPVVGVGPSAQIANVIGTPADGYTALYSSTLKREVWSDPKIGLPPLVDRPYSPLSSAINTPLPAGVALRSDSAQIAAYMVGEVRGIVGQESGGLGLPVVNRDNYSSPLYYVTNDTPRVPVMLSTTNDVQNSPAATPGMDGDPQAHLAWVFAQGVPIPAGATAAGGTDKHMTVVNVDTHEMWEMWLTQKVTRLGNQWGCKWGGYVRDTRTWPGYYADTSGISGLGRQYANWGSTATSIAVTAGMLRDKDIAAGYFPYALGLSIPAAKQGGTVWPAQRGDGASSDTYAPPEGSLFQLDPTFDVTQIIHSDAPTQKLARAIATAAKTYGVVVVDFAGSVSMRAEVVGSPAGLGTGGGSGQDASTLFWETARNRLNVIETRSTVGGFYRPASATTPTINAGSTSLTFDHSAQDATPPAKAIELTHGGAVDYTRSLAATSNQTWLVPTLSATALPATLKCSIDPTALAALANGTYTATVTVSCAERPSITITVTLNKLAPVITVVGSGNASGQGTSATPNRPSGSTTGDLHIVTLSTNPSAPTAVPAGWTEIGTATPWNNGSASTLRRFWVRDTGGSLGSATLPSGTFWGTSTVTLRGAEPTADPIDGSSIVNAGFTTVARVPQVTTTGPNRQVVITSSGLSAGYTMPPGWTIDLNTGDGVARRSKIAAGSTNTVQVNSNAARWVVAGMVAVKPA